MRSPLSEADEENFTVNELTNELFLVLNSKDVRWTRTRVHAHALSLSTSKADKEKMKINERNIPRPHLDDVRWTQRGVRVWEAVVGSCCVPHPSKVPTTYPTSYVPT